MDYIGGKEKGEWARELAYLLGHSRPSRIRSKHTTYGIGVYFEGQMLTPLSTAQRPKEISDRRNQSVNDLTTYRPPTT